MVWSHFISNTDRVIDKWDHYFPIYERHFSKFINQSIFMLEIGVQEGGSLQMWRKYFGPLATIVGIDIEPRCKRIESEDKQYQLKVRIGDQSDLEFLQRIIDEFGIPDIVLDDGSHFIKDVNKSFDYLYPLMHKNSIYMIEDTHCCYMEQTGGGVNVPETFINRTKNFLDEIKLLQKSLNVLVFRLFFLAEKSVATKSYRLEKSKNF